MKRVGWTDVGSEYGQDYGLSLIISDWTWLHSKRKERLLQAAQQDVDMMVFLGWHNVESLKAEVV